MYYILFIYLFVFLQNPQQKEEKFSFLILRRGPGEPQERWPRITQPVLCRPRHVHVHLCCPDGTLQHAVVTPKKHGRYWPLSSRALEALALLFSWGGGGVVWSLNKIQVCLMNKIHRSSPSCLPVETFTDVPGAVSVEIVCLF